MLAQIVYVAFNAVTVGVPVMAQVPLVRLMPVGSAGEMPQVAPLTLGEVKKSPSCQTREPWINTGVFCHLR